MKNQRKLAKLIAITLVLFVGGCHREPEVAIEKPMPDPKLTVETPAEIKDDTVNFKRFKISARAIQEGGSWVPGSMQLSLKTAPPEKTLASTSVVPVKTTDGFQYTEIYPWPKKPGKYYLYLDILEDPASRKSEGTLLKRTKPTIVEFEVK